MLAASGSTLSAQVVLRCMIHCCSHTVYRCMLLRYTTQCSAPWDRAVHLRDTVMRWSIHRVYALEDTTPLSLSPHGVLTRVYHGAVDMSGRLRIILPVACLLMLWSTLRVSGLTRSCAPGHDTQISLWVTGPVAPIERLLSHPVVANSD